MLRSKKNELALARSLSTRWSLILTNFPLIFTQMILMNINLGLFDKQISCNQKCVVSSRIPGSWQKNWFFNLVPHETWKCWSSFISTSLSLILTKFPLMFNKLFGLWNNWGCPTCRSVHRAYRLLGSTTNRTNWNSARFVKIRWEFFSSKFQNSMKLWYMYCQIVSNTCRDHYRTRTWHHVTNYSAFIKTLLSFEFWVRIFGILTEFWRVLTDFD